MSREDREEEPSVSDQLWAQLEGQTGIERIGTLLDLAWSYLPEDDEDRCLSLVDAAIEEGEKCEDQIWLARAYAAKGWVLLQNDRPEEAVSAYVLAIDKFAIDLTHQPEEVATTYLAASTAALRAGDLELAHSLAVKAVEIAQQSENELAIGRTQLQLGDVLEAQDKGSEALEAWAASRLALRQCDNPLEVLNLDVQVARYLLYKERDHQAAVNLYNDCAQVAAAIGTKEDQHIIAFSLGRALLRNGEPYKALNVLQEGCDEVVKLNDLDHAALFYREMAYCRNQLNEVEEAFTLMTKARAFFDVCGSDGEVIDCDVWISASLHNSDRYWEAAQVNEAIVRRASVVSAYWARSRWADNLLQLKDYETALTVGFQDREIPGEIEIGSEAWHWRQAILARTLQETNRQVEAQQLAIEGLENNPSEASAGTRGSYFEFRGDYFLEFDLTRAHADWAQAVAFYLAADWTGAARRISQRFMSSDEELNAGAHNSAGGD